jgi:hypothetical protein
MMVLPAFPSSYVLKLTKRPGTMELPQLDQTRTSSLDVARRRPTRANIGAGGGPLIKLRNSAWEAVDGYC